jgi:hypothetical protein
MGEMELVSQQNTVERQVAPMTDLVLRILIDVGPIALICLSLTMSAILAFPEMDDGYLMLALREISISEIVHAHADRPVVAYLWKAIAELFGGYFWEAGFGLHTLLWTILGVQAAALWRVLYPEAKQYGVVVGCLSVAPITVQCQTSTVTISLIGLLSSVLAYGTLLLLSNLVSARKGPKLTLLSTSLLAFLSTSLLVLGILVSEYAIPVALITIVLCMFMAFDQSEPKARSRLCSWAIIIACTTLATYIVYAATGRGRAEVEPGQVINVHSFYRFPLGMITGAWRVVVGTYGNTVGSLAASLESRSSILAAIFGLFVSTIMMVRCWLDPSFTRPRRRSLLAISAALIAGLTPIVFMRPSISMSPFASRLYIPIIPIATCLTFSMAATLVRKRFRLGVVALAGFLIGYSVFAESWSAYKRQRLMSSLGSYLEQQVKAGDGGLTVAVIANKQNCQSGYECTAKLTSNWPIEIEKKFWAFTKEEALTYLGRRTDCQATPNVDVNVRHVRRRGPLEKVLWIETNGDDFLIDPYSVCQRVNSKKTEERNSYNGREHKPWPTGGDSSTGRI